MSDTAPTIPTNSPQESDPSSGHITSIRQRDTGAKKWQMQNELPNHFTSATDDRLDDQNIEQTSMSTNEW